MRAVATKLRATTVVPSTTVVPITTITAAKRFAVVIKDYEVGELAQAANTTKEAAKLWKAGRRCPNTASIINLASAIPEIDAWVSGEIRQRRDHALARAPVVAGELQQLALQEGEIGAQARALLRKLTGGG